MTVKSCYWILLLLALVWVVSPAIAQKESGKVTVREAIQSFEKREGVRFFYRNDWIEGMLIDKPGANESLIDFLTMQLKNYGLGYMFFYESHYVILFNGAPPASTLRTKSDLDTISAAVTGRADVTHERFTLYGYVKDATIGDGIADATVFIEEQGKGVTSNSEGYFSVSLPAGTYRLRVNAVGKQPSIRGVTVGTNQRLDIDLYEQTTELSDIVILSQSADRNIASTEMSQVKLDLKTLKTIPQFMGEVDVVKSILLLPGVSTVGEGASGFNVRGGNVDQNLILQDDAPLFNSSHLFGFFSTFNPDMVKDVTIMKGGIPANYGGRISSVLDVKLKDGNPDRLSVSGGVGIISSRLLLEGPIGSDKTSFIIGGRYAYPDWIIKKVPDLNVQRSASNFYDFNLRLRHQFNDRNSIYLSTYRSADQFKFAADTTYGWSTTNVSLRWNTTLSSKLYANVTTLYSKYQNQIKGRDATKEFTADFGIETKGGKLDMSYTPGGQHRIDFGANLLSYTFNNGTLTPGPNSSINPVALQEEHSVESAVYLSDEFKVSPALTLHAGIRYSLYTVRGPGDVFVYDPSVPQQPAAITGVLHFTDGQKIKQYSGWEPRVSMKISIDSKSSIKLSYNRNLQYLQLISNTTAVSPLDLWKSSNYYIKPPVGNQFAIGYFRNFNENKLELSVESYYKQVDNLVEYKDGANLFLNPYLESALLNAKGEAYGAEFMIRKKEGSLTGWIAYTYARSLRQVKGNTPEETINFGKQYPSNYDKPNDLTVVASYSFTRRLSLSANFVYSTGRPITYPESVYVLDGYAVSQFSQRNQVRIPDYHRLDISFTIQESLKRTRKWKGSWTFSVYNVYGRLNPYSVFFKPQYNGFQTQSYRLAVIGTIFPSITYNFKF